MFLALKLEEVTVSQEINTRNTDLEPQKSKGTDSPLDSLEANVALLTPDFGFLTSRTENT